MWIINLQFLLLTETYWQPTKVENVNQQLAKVWSFKWQPTGGPPHSDPQLKFQVPGAIWLSNSPRNWLLPKLIPNFPTNLAKRRGKVMSIPAVPMPPGLSPRALEFFIKMGKFPGVGTHKLSKCPWVRTKKEGKCLAPGIVAFQHFCGFQ